MPLKLPQEYLDWILKKTNQIHLAALIRPPDLSSVWNHLKISEKQWMGQDSVNIGVDPEDLSEYGLTLYAINHLIPVETTKAFKSLGLPDSSITPIMWETESGSNIPSFMTTSEFIGAKREVIRQDVPFGNLDPGWAMSGICYLFKELGIIETHEFTKTPVTLTLEDQGLLRIAIIGDWGTGYWKDGSYEPPAKLIAEAIEKFDPPPDLLIHLGDVYYTGLEHEEQRNFIDGFPCLKSGYHFTLNSNHEAYNGSNGYYAVALNDKLFVNQGGCSYFALHYGDWIVIGLDSAYFDKSMMIQKGALTDDTNTFQQDFIQSLKIQENQKILLLTHHPGMDLTGKFINRTLTDQVCRAFGDTCPEYWYYGHLHNGVVYSENSAIKNPSYHTRSGGCPKLRCVGHSSIPFGDAGLCDLPELEYYAHTGIPNPDQRQINRILNGFALISLSKSQIKETFYEVSPTTGAFVAWQG